mgnify:FL=1
MGETKKKKISVYLGSDHAGFYLKERTKRHLAGKEIPIIDMGAYSYNKEDDYTDFIMPVARKVAKNSNTLGIIFGGSGQGEAMAANKIKGIRCAVYYGRDEQILKLSKEHNNSNMLSIGARFVASGKIEKIADLWIKAKFSDKTRHKRRVKKLGKLGSV